MSLPAPIAYFGGKSHLRSFILPHIEDGNQIYVEPFCGSANIFFAKTPHPVEVINDLDGNVVNFFRVLQNRRLFRHFAHRARWTPFAQAEFDEAVRILRSTWDGELSLDHAWAFFVRGTLGFGGKGMSPGEWRRALQPSVGISSTCQNWRNRMRYLEDWRDRLLGVQIDHRPALDVIRFYDTPTTTFYLDPPYATDTRTSKTVYRHEMNDSDQGALVQALRTVQGRVVMSGYETPLYAALERDGWLRFEKTILSPMTGSPVDDRQTGHRSERTEVLWINRAAGPSLFDDELDEARAAVSRAVVEPLGGPEPEPEKDQAPAEKMAPRTGKADSRPVSKTRPVPESGESILDIIQGFVSGLGKHNDPMNPPVISESTCASNPLSPIESSSGSNPILAIEPSFDRHPTSGSESGSASNPKEASESGSTSNPTSPNESAAASNPDHHSESCRASNPPRQIESLASSTTEATSESVNGSESQKQSNLTWSSETPPAASNPQWSSETPTSSNPSSASESSLRSNPSMFSESLNESNPPLKSESLASEATSESWPISNPNCRSEPAAASNPNTLNEPSPPVIISESLRVRNPAEASESARDRYPDTSNDESKTGSNPLIANEPLLQSNPKPLSAINPTPKSESQYDSPPQSLSEPGTFSNPNEIIESIRTTDPSLPSESGIVRNPTESSEPPPVSNPSPRSAPTSLLEFLNEPRPVDDNLWTPQSPPSLDGIDEVIVNVETNGLSWAKGDRPIGITVGTPDGLLTRFLPFGFRGQNLDEAVVKRWAERELRGRNILNANTRFDIHMLRAWGVDLTEQDNTFGDIQHYAALCDDHRKRFSLDALAAEVLDGVRVPRVDERRMADYEASDVAERAEYQIELVARLRDVFWPEMNAQDLHRVRELEDRVIPVVVEMEKNAAPIDRALLVAMTRDAEQEYVRLLHEVSSACGFTFDDKPESWERLFTKLDLPLTKLASGKATFKDDIVARVDHPVVKLARYAAQLDSLRSKIFKPYNELVGEDGLLRFDLHQLRSEEGGTVSGRFSGAYIQQVPNHDNHSAIFGEKYFPRQLYVPGSGLFLAGDAAQIEYRLFTHYSKNKKVIAAYHADVDMSFHKMIYAMLVPYKKDLSYVGTKSLNFMTLYGGSLVKTAVMMGFITEEEGTDIQQQKSQRTDPRLAQAREVAAIYAREIPEVKPMLAMAMHFAKSECDEYCNKSDNLHRQYPHRGYVTTLLGRRARFPTTYKIHKALNSIIQGSAADIMKTKLVELYQERRALGLTMRMTIHDEVTGDIPDVESAKRVETLLNRQSFDLLVPIRWSVGTGATWADAK